MKAATRAGLTHLPLVAALDHGARERLLGLARPLRVDRGDFLVREGEAAEHVYLLLSGEVGVWSRGRLLTVLPTPRVEGLLAALDHRPRSASLEAVRQVEGFALPRGAFDALLATEPSFSRAVLTALAADTRDAHAAIDRERGAFDDFFQAPHARLVPGPYVAESVEMLNFVLHDPAGRAAALLPDGCRPIPGLAGVVLLTIDTFTDVHTLSPAGEGRRMSYQEVTPFVPCLGPGLQPAMFCAELFPDNYLAILLGRELYGFPKRFGRIERSGDAVHLLADHRRILRAGWREIRPVAASDLGRELARRAPWALPSVAADAAGLLVAALTHPAAQARWPRLPVLVRKQIPQASSVYDRRLQIDELVRIPFEVHAAGDHAILDEPEVEIVDDRGFLGSEVVAAFGQTLRFSFGAGEVLKDYLEDAPARSGERPRGRLGHLWRAVRGSR